MNSIEEKDLEIGKRIKIFYIIILEMCYFVLKKLTISKIINKTYAVKMTPVFLCFRYFSIHVLCCLRRNV